jgi:MoaA/NifB/PqqE/SkfB family radical SAM enzyme
MLAFVKNYMKNYAALSFFGPSAVRYPLLVSFYVTHRCNLKCTYCSDGIGNPFYELHRNELNLQQITELFRRIIASTQVLDITGGEPLLRIDIEEIILAARTAGFHTIYLNTNGLLLGRYPQLIQMVDKVYVSIDSLDVKTLMQIYRTDEDNVICILQNLDKFSENSNASKIIISAVLLRENLDHIPSLLDYCKQNGFGFTVSPALNGTKMDKNLQTSAQYQRCIDSIVDYKKNGLNVIGSIQYFDIIRGRSQFTCYPMLMPIIDPEGKVYLPCLEIANTMVSLFDYQDLNHLIGSFSKTQHTSVECKDICQILCHAGLSTMLDNPMSAMYEAYQFAKVRTRKNGIEFVSSHHHNRIST